MRQKSEALGELHQWVADLAMRGGYPVRAGFQATSGWCHLIRSRSPPQRGAADQQAIKIGALGVQGSIF